MLDTLTLHLDTIQQFSQRRVIGTHDRIVDRKNVAEQIDALVQEIDEISNLAEAQWNSFSERQKQELRAFLPSLDRALEFFKGWQGFILSIELLPASIQKRKNLRDCLVRSLSRYEQVVSDQIARENIRTGWKEVMTGKTIPLSELWDELDDE